MAERTLWKRLIEDFDLEREVKQFVYERVAELQKEERHTFSFGGGRRDCDNERPHVPHVTGSYSTVRYGWLQNYCLGVTGEEKDDPVIIVESYSGGSPEAPGRARGFWYMRKALADAREAS